MTDRTRVDELLDQWQTARQQGRDLSAEELCPDCPELLSELRQKIESLQLSDGEVNTGGDDPAIETTYDEIRSHRLIDMHCQLTGLRFLARGGLGVVCTARDEKLSRELAIKFLRRRLATVAECRERFLVEAEVTSRLEHPGIVPVHGIGETENGRLFYVMRLIQGDTLENAIARLHSNRIRLTTQQQHAQLRELLGHFMALCKTVAYAHNRGIVHRDIKPANVMLGRFGETILVDWGLALPVGRQGVFKQSSERTLSLGSGTNESSNTGAGTPAYMSPEQATLGAELDQRSDIYSLGATLYKLISGKSAFEGPASDVRLRVIRGDFPPPTQVNRHVSRALEAICLKAMSVRPDNRYATALELAQDVDNYLADASVSAFDEPVLRRFARWTRRHSAVVQGIMGGLTLFTVAVVVAALLIGKQARRETQLKEDSLRTSAQFAAHTIANQVDICWRSLEKMAADPKLHELMGPVNSAPLERSHWKPLQQWLNTYAQEYELLKFRSLFVMTADGTQVARYPEYVDSESGPELANSLGQNLSYRDYFHAAGEDDRREGPLGRAPCTLPHVAAIHESTNGGTLAEVFSVPIRLESNSPPIGVLGMAISLGDFTALELDLPIGQQVMLVDTRQYYLERQHPKPHRESGEGLILHHAAMGDLTRMERLPHIDLELLSPLSPDQREAAQQDLPSRPGSMINNGFHDPLAEDSNSRSLAACAPVIVNTRPDTYNNTGWLLIVQQAD